jgi:hypothetical protein
LLRPKIKKNSGPVSRRLARRRQVQTRAARSSTASSSSRRRPKSPISDYLASPAVPIHPLLSPATYLDSTATAPQRQPAHPPFNCSLRRPYRATHHRPSRPRRSAPWSDVTLTLGHPRRGCRRALGAREREPPLGFGATLETSSRFYLARWLANGDLEKPYPNPPRKHPRPTSTVHPVASFF